VFFLFILKGELTRAVFFVDRGNWRFFEGNFFDDWEYFEEKNKGDGK